MEYYHILFVFITYRQSTVIEYYHIKFQCLSPINRVLCFSTTVLCCRLTDTTDRGCGGARPLGAFYNDFENYGNNDDEDDDDDVLLTQKALANDDMLSSK